ncbi:MAG TPA: PQQ-binding-like beta-propeller repeat protein, partial [Patescibacteria group bacterium]|nr:PQQ-binding-like beta-propeller repeat protein [Patescibacteria group bacterium]
MASDLPAVWSVARTFSENVFIGPDNNPVMTATHTSGGQYFNFSKYDGKTGETIWTKQHEVPGTNRPPKIIMDHNGDILMTRFVATWFSGPEFSSSSYDFEAMKFSGETGELIWRNYFDGGYHDYITAVAVDSQNNIAVVGDSSDVSDNYRQNLLIVKYNGNDGSVLWQKTYNSSATDGSVSDSSIRIATGPDDNITVVGISFQIIDQGSESLRRLHVLRYDGSTGGLIWDSSFNLPAASGNPSLAIGQDANPVVAWSVYNGTADESGSYITIFKLHGQTGDLLWTKTFNGDGGPGGVTDLIVDHQNNPIIVGSSGFIPPSPYELTAHPSYNMRTVKFASATGDIIWNNLLDISQFNWYGSYWYGQEGKLTLDQDNNPIVLASGREVVFDNNSIYEQESLLLAKYANDSGDIVWHTIINPKTNAPGDYPFFTSFGADMAIGNDSNPTIAYTYQHNYANQIGGYRWESQVVKYLNLPTDLQLILDIGESTNPATLFFGLDSTRVHKFGQSFVVDTDSILHKLELEGLAKENNPSDSVILNIYEGGAETGPSLGTSLPINAADISTTLSPTTFYFPNPIPLTKDVKYFVVIERTGNISNSDFYELRLNTPGGNSHTKGERWGFVPANGGWKATTQNDDIPMKLYGILNINQPPTLAFSPESGYDGLDAIDPNGGPVGTMFTFKVVYTNPDNLPPIMEGGIFPAMVDDGMFHAALAAAPPPPNEGVKLIVRGTMENGPFGEFDLLRDTTDSFGFSYLHNGDYTDGEQFGPDDFQVNFDTPGIYEYHFETFVDGLEFKRFPESGKFTFELGEENHAPTLEFVQEDGYMDDGVNPDKGTVNLTNFFFKILYKDADDDPPQQYVHAVIEKKNEATGEYQPFEEPYLMFPATDRSYIEGNVFAANRTFPKGQYRYHFETSDGVAVVQTDSHEFISDFSNIAFFPGHQASRLYLPGDHKIWEPGIVLEDGALVLSPTTGESVNQNVYTKDVIDEALGFNVYKKFQTFMSTEMQGSVINEWRAFPYDWRLDLDHMLYNGTVVGINNNQDSVSYTLPTGVPYLLQRLWELAATSKSGSVTIVTHSNGGLLAKYLINALTDPLNPLYEHPSVKPYRHLAQRIDRIIMIAAPQLGTPKAVEALLHGDSAQLGKFDVGVFLDEEQAREFGENMVSAYNLIPSKRYFDIVASPVIEFDPEVKNIYDFPSLYGKDIDNAQELHQFLLGDNGVRPAPNPEDTDIPNVLKSNFLTRAINTHKLIDA